MPRKSWQMILLVTALGLVAGPLPAQADAGLTRLLVQSYDLLEAGQLAQAQKIYEQILARDPGNPLALNNLGAIKVKENKFPEALTYLSQALPRARGYKIKVNRVCALDGICLAFRPLEEVYGDTELEPLIKFNIDMVKARLATR
ncbi:MAG: tetratricopeptide repeat protein [Syntrophobacterales bacterium]|jgi:tetratricopeptide (TPR) repeat protein|nr:tetratricopeptide repeat protein [Syntrophobacterales bacterium]